MLPVAEPASTSMDRLIEQVPDLLDRIDAWRAEKKTPQPCSGNSFVRAAPHPKF